MTQGNGIQRDRVMISIVLLTYNGMPVVENCLRLIFQQVVDAAIEIVHIDSGSTDGTLDVARAYSLDTRHISKRDFHHSRTRTIAAHLARGNVVVYLTQDAVPESPSWLSNLIAPFRDPTVGAVYGRQIAPVGVGPVRRCALTYLYPAQREVRQLSALQPLSLSMVRFSDANSAIRKELIVRFQFDERALVCEDHGICRDILVAGYKVVYEPNAAVIHGHERNLYSEFQWAVDNGISLTRMGILDRKAGASSELRYGLSSVAKQVRHFAHRHEYGNAAISICTNVVRWFGVQLGKREDSIPSWLLRRMSSGLRRASTESAG
jgi:rhamnosyltransferase